MDVTFSVNGDRVRLDVEPRHTLADTLREECGLTGTHLGCEHGVCGTCTVLVDGEPARACLMFTVQADGSSVTTVEGLAGDDGELHPLQEAFIRHHGLQCGFCTPGMLISALHLLDTDPEPNRETIRAEMSGNIPGAERARSHERRAQFPDPNEFAQSGPRPRGASITVDGGSGTHRPQRWAHHDHEPLRLRRVRRTAHARSPAVWARGRAASGLRACEPATARGAWVGPDTRRPHRHVDDGRIWARAD